MAKFPDDFLVTSSILPDDFKALVVRPLISDEDPPNVYTPVRITDGVEFFPLPGNLESVNKTRVKKRFEFNDTSIYIGFAPLGTADATSAWTIKKITLDANGDMTHEQWSATGSISWTDRAIATYT
jgi:hypothetical protein